MILGREGNEFRSFAFSYDVEKVEDMVYHGSIVGVRILERCGNR